MDSMRHISYQTWFLSRETSNIGLSSKTGEAMQREGNTRISNMI